MNAMQTWAAERFSTFDGSPFVESYTCPACGTMSLHRVRDCQAAHFLCPSCRRCWQRSRSGYRLVDALACGGCAEQSKGACLNLMAVSFPQFGSG
ncbi:MAG TPA: hypothetical protein VFR41_09325 [Acidimicrobiia bacterium]|nr:hypothetical protein [Acidimicrobiia bacterium]